MGREQEALLLVRHEDLPLEPGVGVLFLGLG